MRDSVWMLVAVRLLCVVAWGSNDLPADIDPVTGLYRVPVVSDEQSAPQDNRPEVILYSNGSSECFEATRAIEKDEEDLPFRLTVVMSNKAPSWVKTFPTLYWGDGPTVYKSKQCWFLHWHGGLKNLIDSFEKTRNPHPVKKVKPVQMMPYKEFHVGFGVPFVETATGRTSVGHLTGVHRIPYPALVPYVHNQRALDSIHGWAHGH